MTSNAALIGNQPGTLSADLDVRVTTGEISPVNPSAGLVLDAPLAPKFAIVKFSLKNSDDGAITAKSLAVTIGTEAFVATPASAASEFYLALPAVSSGTLIFSVPGNEGTSSYRSSKAITKSIEAGKYYRSTVQMTVQSDNPNYIQMGDGKKWALKNVGASSPADYGDYFAWGETEPKSAYDWANYIWANGAGNKLTKYCDVGSYGNDGYTDELTTLVPDDDAATQRWGTPWRMPTIAEWETLLNTSDFTWAWVENFNNTGANGRLVISRISGFVGNCIFLPAAGRRSSFIRGAGSDVIYWSSSLYTGYPDYANELYFSPDYALCRTDTRDYGQSVRAVQAME